MYSWGFPFGMIAKVIFPFFTFVGFNSATKNSIRNLKLDMASIASE